MLTGPWFGFHVKECFSRIWVSQVRIPLQASDHHIAHRFRNPSIQVLWMGGHRSQTAE